MKDSDNLIWIDLEMTGLSPEYNQILEIATVVTDKHLNVIAHGPVFALKTETGVLETMDDWNQKHHRASGLYQRALQSRVTLEQAELMTIAFLNCFIDAGVSPMCGNTISMDRQFLNRYMPKLASFFHYRQIDVSTIKELVKRWYPQVAKFEKESRHLALSDIYDSIEELKFYRQHYFRNA
jgi:oligoribonuclease